MIYSITNGTLTARIDSLGAQLISLRDAGETEYIWQRKAPHWENCAPILFPIVGRCRDGVISISGIDYPMAEIHGFASSMEYEVVSQTESAITLRLSDTDYTRAKYPFAFALDVTHKVEGDTFTTSLSVENHSDSIMPFGIGGHPGICCPLTEGEAFTDYELDFGKPVTLDTTCIDDDFSISSTLTRRVVTDSQTLPLDRELFIPDALIFENPPFREVVFRSRKSGMGIRFGFQNFTTFAFWTETPPAEAPFLCFEPWNGMGLRSGEGTELAEKKGSILLEPQKTFTCDYCVTPLKGV